jgi:hypothetical protein
MRRRGGDPAARLRQRLDAFGSSFDARHVLEPEAVKTAEEVLGRAGGRVDARTAEAVFLVACFYWYRFQVLPAGRQQADLDQAVALTEALIAAVPQLVPASIVMLLAAHGSKARRPEPPDGGAQELFLEATQIMGRAEQSGDYSGADRAADLLGRAVAKGKGPARLHFLSALGRVHRDIFLHRGRSPGHLRKAVELHRESLESTPGGDRERPTRMFNLGNVLGDLFEVSGDQAPLNESIVLLGDVERSAGVDPRIRALAQANLGQRLRDRWLSRRDRADLDRAVETLAAAVAALSDARLLVVLGTAYAERYVETRDIADRDRAIDIFRNAPEADAALGPLLGDRYESTNDPDDLDAAIDAYRNAGGAAMRHATGHLLETRYEHDRQGEDLNEAIHLLRLSVDEAVDDETRGERLASLAYTFSRWHADLPGIDGSRLAEEALIDAERLLPAGHPARPDALNNLGNLWRENAGRTGRIDQLEPAAALLREAAAADSPKTPLYLSNLSLVLQALFGHTQDMPTLTEAIEVLRRALATTPPDYPDRLLLLTNYGSALNRRVEATADDKDQNKADVTASVASLREAASLVRRDGDAETEAAALGTLGLANLSRYQVTGDAEALDEAVEALDRARDLAGPADRRRVLTNLGNVLLLRSRLDGRSADLPAALEAYRRAPEGLDAGHAERTMYLLNIATALDEALGVPERAQAEVEGLRNEALAALSAASAVEAAPSLLRATAAQRYAALAEDAGDPTAALQGYTTAIELLDLVAWHGMDPDDQARLLTRFAGLAGAAAACAIGAGRPERAVELLEYGRGVLLTRVRDARVSLDRLREREPALADRLAEVQSLLDGASANGVPERRHETAVQRREVLADIRRVPGFADFLRPPVFADLARAADRGPVVLVNVAGRRCDALVLDGGEVRVVSLPGLIAGELVDRVVAFLTAVGVVTSSAGDRDRLRARRTIAETIEWLSSVVAGPVLDVLGPEVSRVWWCPTGLLSLLPLHAAALDRTIPSYTASLRELLHEDANVVDAALFVGMPKTPGRADLPGVAREEQIVAGHVTRVRSLVGPEARKEDVLAALAEHPAVHFSCHGSQDLAVPALGRLALADGPLSVRDLWELRSTGPAGLAVLSACETVRGGAALPDETISLGTAFQIAGFRNVIGSLWSIADSVTAVLCARLYDGLAVPDGIDPSRSAVALHAAVMEIRQALPDAPEFWAAYAHFGP